MGEVIGLIPAAGRATRLQPIPCSKELLPVGFQENPRTGQRAPKVASHYLLEKFRAAGISKTYVVIREGKWDIPQYFLTGDLVDISLSYLVIADSIGPPDSVDRAFPFVRHSLIAFGFPDILFGPQDAYAQLISKQKDTGADVVLGLHLIRKSKCWDMVAREANGRVTRIDMKPESTTLSVGWHFAVWTPVFSEFLHQFLRSEKTLREMARMRSPANDPSGDLAFGVVLQAALAEGLHVQSVSFPGDGPLDLGSPETLYRAINSA